MPTFDLAEKPGVPSKSPRKYYPSITVPAVIGAPGEELEATVKAVVVAVESTKERGKSTRLELRSISAYGKKQAIRHVTEAMAAVRKKST